MFLWVEETGSYVSDGYKRWVAMLLWVEEKGSYVSYGYKRWVVLF
jgi:hypothetical protein